jgi:hypothetical protein
MRTALNISNLAEQSKPELPASNTSKRVRDTPAGRTKINAAITMLMIWALERGEPWDTSQPDTDRSTA